MDLSWLHSPGLGPLPLHRCGAGGKPGFSGWSLCPPPTPCCATPGGWAGRPSGGASHSPQPEAQSRRGQDSCRQTARSRGRGALKILRDWRATQKGEGGGGPRQAASGATGRVQEGFREGAGKGEKAPEINSYVSMFQGRPQCSRDRSDRAGLCPGLQREPACEPPAQRGWACAQCCLRRCYGASEAPRDIRTSVLSPRCS